MHLNKFLAHTGICSRRNAVHLIKEGNIKVNNIVIKEPGYQVTEQDTVTIKGKKIKPERTLYILLNKPKGYITSLSDEKGRPTVIDLIGSTIKKRIYPIGRLDQDTTGILLLTNDGTLAHKLAHPRYEIQKTYVALLDKPLEIDDLHHIKQGVHLSDGWVQVDTINFMLRKPKNYIRITLHNGKYRIIRRLFEQLGYTVLELDRIAFAGLTKNDVRRGMWRFLRPGELKHLKNI